MDHAAYFQAALPDPYRLLGLQLKPLSLGRYRLLRRFECAFAADEPIQVGLGDLVIGVLICSQKVDECLRWLNGPTVKKDIRRWGRKIHPLAFLARWPLVGRWWKKRYAWNVIEKIKLFQRYVKDQTRMPTVFFERESQTVSGAHWSQTLEVLLRSELGWTDEQINEAPISKALFDYFKWGETQGSVQMVDEAAVEELKAQAEANSKALGLN